jgi:hypothetical protein
MTMSMQEMLAPAGQPPEAAGPLDDSPNGSCAPAAPDPRPHAISQPVSAELQAQQNAAAADRAAK